MYGLYASDRNGIVEKGERFEMDFLVYIYITEFKLEARRYCKFFFCKQKSVVYLNL